jgi:hypothetical protein
MFLGRESQTCPTVNFGCPRSVHIGRQSGASGREAKLHVKESRHVYRLGVDINCINCRDIDCVQRHQLKREERTFGMGGPYGDDRVDGLAILTGIWLGLQPSRGAVHDKSRWLAYSS